MKYNNFLGYHSSNSSALDGLQKSDILDEDRYSELIRDIYIQIISDSDQAAQESDIDAMNEYFEEKGYGFTFVSDEPIKASSYQYTEYKYGDYLYKVYGTGKEIVLDDPNEIGAEIIISKAPLLFKKVDSLNENKKMRLFINEDKFNAALSAKRGADQILTFLKGLILRKNFEKSPYIKMFLDGKMSKYDNEKNAGTIKIRINTKGRYFKGGFFKKMPDFNLILKDNLEHRGEYRVTFKTGEGKNYTISLNMDGHVKYYMDDKIDKRKLISKILSRKDTLVHELSHMYDDVVNKQGDYDAHKKDNKGYFFSKTEDFAFKAQAFNHLIENEIEKNLIGVIKNKKKYPEITKDMSIKEFIDLEGFDKRHLYNVFSEYMKSLMYRYRLKPDDAYNQGMRDDFDKFYKKILPYIIKNIKGIKDGSIKDKNQFMLPKIKK